MPSPVVTLHRSHTGPDRGEHFWLLHDATTVGYCKVYALDGRVGLCDIETREEYRNQGIAADLLARVADHSRVPAIAHVGGYTSDGHAFLRGMVERADGWPEKSDYAAMSFVRDWASLQIMYP